MDLIVNGYASSSEEEEEKDTGTSSSTPSQSMKRSRRMNAAPVIPSSYSSNNIVSSSFVVSAITTTTTTTTTNHNHNSHEPMKEAVDWSNFDEQRKSFQRYGKAVGPDGQPIERGTYGHNTIVERIIIAKDDEDDDEEIMPKRTKKKQKRVVSTKQTHFVEDEEQYGIWAPPSMEEREVKEATMSCMEKLQSGLLTELQPQQVKERTYILEEKNHRDNNNSSQTEEQKEQQLQDRLVERKVSHLLPPTIADQPMDATTTFHFPDEHFNYKGQSWIAPPAGTPSSTTTTMDEAVSYVPKKCVGRFPSSHSKGVHRIRLFPNTAHLLLSAGLDGTCRVWNIADKKCMRTYHGHTAAVRDVQFAPSNGTTFLSCSFDRYIRLWDTESGNVLNTFTNRRVPYVLQYYPKDEDYFVVGCSDNKIVTYQISTGQITQEYNHHLAPVNTITFLQPPDTTIKMITSSDDKKVLIWEWDIAVPIKYVSDPTMHSMPVMTLHPSHQYMVGQSLDNHIAVYQCSHDKFTCMKKKKFTGHNIAGYACDITISPDGRFVGCGDGNGNLFFWDWKKTKLLQKYRAHDNGPAIGCIWHPTQPSTVFTCGWDGQIKIWQ